MKNNLVFPMEEKYEEYLRDESKYEGSAQSISFPESEEEIITILGQIREEGQTITIQGGKTGLVGAAVPKGGHIMNLSKMNQTRDISFLEDKTALFTVEPGINLIDLKKEINKVSRKEPLFWPPEPTETSATVGGVAALNAKGICAYLYGDTNKYIEKARMIKYDGSIIAINRGKEFRLINGNKVDLLDLVLGKEGITGVFTELTLRLIPKPKSVWGISFFFEEKKDVTAFIKLIQNVTITELADIAAIEYIDRNTIDLIESRKNTMTKIKELPDVEKQFTSMIYMELHGEEEGIEELAEALMEYALEANSDPDKAWAVSGEMEIEKMHAFRHAAAETVNLAIEEIRREDKRITKLGTDMSLSNLDFKSVLWEYEDDIKNNGLKSCIFGHVYENRLHINLLPESYSEYEKGIELLKKWAKRVKDKSGNITCEHGIGKLKKDIYKEEIPEMYVKVCKSIKEEFDPIGIWNKGNIFD